VSIGLNFGEEYLKMTELKKYKYELKKNKGEMIQ